MVPNRGKKSENAIRFNRSKINFYVFVTRHVFEENKSLDISFFNAKTNKLFKVNYEKKFEEIEQYGIVKFVFTVTFPPDFLQNEQLIKYFYYKGDMDNDFERNQENDSRKIRNLSLKEGKTNVIDGLALFEKDKLSRKEFKSIKCRILRSLIDLEHLWHQSICVEFNKLIQLMKTIFENLCLNDLEYKNEFEKVNEKHFY